MLKNPRDERGFFMRVIVFLFAFLLSLPAVAQTQGDALQSKVDAILPENSFDTLPTMVMGYPAYREIYVNDFADLLSDEVESQLRQTLMELRNETGVEFTVVTIRSMLDYGHSGAIEPFATGLFNAWGVGDKDKNNGLMMLIAQNDRVMRIEVGAGYGTELNAPMKRIIDKKITPYFAQYDFEKGILIGTDEAIYAATGFWPGQYHSGFLSKVWYLLREVFDLLKKVWIFAVVVAVPFAANRYRRWRRDRPRVCPHDGSMMERLSEDWEDNHLQQGQITEEQLKSVDYDVWECPQCQHIKVEGYRRFFSRYSVCRKCGYRTVEGETTVLKHATKSTTGLKRVDYVCRNCGDEYSVKKIIPKLTTQSSSSSGGGGGFGGGRSSGGGASGSW